MRNDLGPEIVKDIFWFAQKPYNLTNDSGSKSEENCTVYFGTENISSHEPKIWEIVPCEIKSEMSLDIFKEKKLWITDICPFSLCKRYIGHVGFV